MTSSRVKFSYHPNGRAHFSQTGKVKTVVIGSLPPLLMHDGVLFQVQAYGFDHYALVVPKDSKRVLVDCTPDPDALGVVVTGHISSQGYAPSRVRESRGSLLDRNTLRCSSRWATRCCVRLRTMTEPI